MKRLILFIAFFFAISNVVIAQQFKLYIIPDSKSNGMKSTLKNEGIDEAKIIYGRYIYKSSFPYFMERSYRANIRKTFPDSLASGIGLIDWEGKGYSDLMGENGIGAVNKVLPEFQTALNIAKSMRPNVKWGFYGIPFRISTEGKIKNQSAWKASNDRIISIMGKSDILVPVIYDSYSYRNFSDDLSVLQKEYINAINYGKQCGISVMPVVWHRYLKTVNGVKTPLMSNNDFANIINMINSHKTDNVKGIIWWAVDDKFYNRNLSSNKVNNQSKDYDKVIDNYSRLFKQNK